MARYIVWTADIFVSAVVSDWWCCRAGAVESSSAVVAGKVVPNRRKTHRWLHQTLGQSGIPWGIQRTLRDTRGDTTGGPVRQQIVKARQHTQLGFTRACGLGRHA